MDDVWQVIREIKFSEPIIKENFWNGIFVWIERPHVLNRRLLAAELKQALTISKLVENQLKENLLKLSHIQNLSSENFQTLLQNNFHHVNEINPTKCIDKLININSGIDDLNVLLVRNLLSRNMKIYQDITEICHFDKYECSVSFFPMKTHVLMYPLSPTFPYRIKLNNDRLILEVFMRHNNNPEDDKSKRWLASEMLPKIYKWCKHQPDEPVVPSLNLLSVRNYNTTLHRLKEKYSKYYIELWPQYNNTDPLKFVHEDISISAYLITLWEKEKERCNLKQKQTFVDLACGNGLLVDILTSEGYDGIGIDLRKRKIWDSFKCKDKLLEMVINPHSQLFSNYEWLIGNHPDELTPWIPIIASRSSYKTKIFLMPCCCYTFNGKYARCDAGLTRYQSYLKFIQSVCKETGFNVQQDKLRIPSTKRSCFVCMSRSYDEKDEAKIDLKRNELINSELNTQVSSNTFDKESITNNNEQNVSQTLNNSMSANKRSNFKPREQTEPVQNCTSLDRNIINNIVFAVVRNLLSKENFELIEREDQVIKWNTGGMSKLEDLIMCISPELLKCLKHQNGGFQTLLRNHKHIFDVKNGQVRLKRPVTISSQNPATKSFKKNTSSYKTKKCFFYFNHPQSCPLSTSACTFLHEEIVITR